MTREIDEKVFIELSQEKQKKIIATEAKIRTITKTARKTKNSTEAKQSTKETQTKEKIQEEPEAP